MSILWAWLSKYALAGAATVGAALLVALGVQTHRVKIAKAETQEVRDLMALREAQATSIALAETTKRRHQEQQTQAQQKEAADESQRLATRARSAAAGAADADAGLRIAARAAARSCAAAADSSTTAVSPADRITDVLGESTSEYRAVAAVADAAIIAGRECSARYDALTPSSLTLPPMKLGRP